MADIRFTEQMILENARHAYEKGQASFEIVPERCALLVIDMQDEFIRPEWSPYWTPEATRQVPRIKRLIEHCRGRKIPVIYTVFTKTHENYDRPVSGKYMPNRYPSLEFDQSQLFVDSHVWHEIAPEKGEVVIYKPSYGAFYDTPLETILKHMDKDTVIICGTLTNYCCGTTARQAYERGYKVVFGSDINATDDPALQEPELKTLRKGFARIMTCDEIVSALL
jgi:nicotinamidase-related amidase